MTKGWSTKVQLISPNKNIKKRLEDNSFKESGYKSIVMKSLQIFLKKKKKETNVVNFA